MKLSRDRVVINGQNLTLEIHIDSEDDWGPQIDFFNFLSVMLLIRSGLSILQDHPRPLAVAKPDGGAMRPGEIVGTDLRNGRRRGHTSDGNLNPGAEDGENENADADQDHDRIQT
jgi:hypothetical protein